MERTLRLDRRYTFGDYKYATIFDDIVNVPDELAFNSKFVDTIRYIQFLGFEIAYRRYVKLLIKYPHTVDNIDKVIEELEKIKDDELEKLHIIMNGYKEKET